MNPKQMRLRARATAAEVNRFILRPGTSSTGVALSHEIGHVHDALPSPGAHSEEGLFYEILHYHRHKAAIASLEMHLGALFDACLSGGAVEDQEIQAARDWLGRM